LVRPHEGKTVIDGRNSGAAARTGTFQRGGRCGECHGVVHFEARADRKDIGAVKDVAGACRVDDGGRIRGAPLQVAVLVPITPSLRVTATTRQLNRVSLFSDASSADPAKEASAGSEKTA
jgi:hypothetical protein